MRLILFLGAGVSVPSGLPNAKQLTDQIFESSRSVIAATERVRSLLDVIRNYDTADIKRVGSYPAGDRFKSSGAIYRGGASTYEDLFFLCQQISLWNIGLSDNSLATPFMESIERKAGALLQGPSVEARLCDLASMGRLCCSFIESMVAEALQKEYLTGFDLILALATAREIEQLNIVTLNHDTLVEQFLSANGMPFVDGFGARDGDVRWYDDGVYGSPDARARLFKLHGSVNWYSFLQGGRGRTAMLLRDDPASAKDGSAKQLKVEFGGPSFLSGINKSVSYQRGLFADIHFHFSEILRQCDRILMSGYGWGDSVINFQLDTWFDRSRSNRAVLLHRNSRQLCDNSLVMASGYDAWVRAGQLICIDRWLCEASLSDVSEHLFNNPSGNTSSIAISGGQGSKHSGVVK